MPADLRGRRVQVTGGASGISAACAEEFAGAGAAVTVADLEADRARAVAEEKFRLILALMLEAPFRLVRAALPHMYAQGWGRVVNISSVPGLRASAYESAYVAAKHGLEGLSKTIALEHGGRGVTSNTTYPSYVRTPLVERQVTDQDRVHGIPESEVIEKIIPSGSLAPSAASIGTVGANDPAVARVRGLLSGRLSLSHHRVRPAGQGR